VFDEVKHRCDLNRGKQYTADSFEQMMKPLVGAAVALPGGAEIALDWRRGGSMALVGNQAMKTHVTRQLSKTLMAADDDSVNA